MTPAELREREQHAEEAAEQAGEKASQMEATAGEGSSATRGATRGCVHRRQHPQRKCTPGLNEAINKTARGTGTRGGSNKQIGFA